MPRIPVYEQSQSQTQTLPSPSINPVMPDASAGIREGVQDMMRTINKAREEANAFRVQDALNKLNAADNQLLYGDNTPDQPAQSGDMTGVAFQIAKSAQVNRERGAFNFKGEQVYNREGGKPLADEYGGKYDAKIAEILNTLGNDDQKRQFTARAAQMKAGFDERVRAHEHQQASAYQKDVWQGTVKTEIENASRNYTDPISLQDSMTRIVDATRLYGSAQGMSKNSINQMVLDATSDMHTVVINRLLEEQKPLAAREYYALHRDAINNKDAGAAIKALGVVGIDAQVSSYVDELVGGEFGPQNDDRKPFQIDKMAQQVREKYKDNPAARDVALKQLVERKQFHDAGVAERLQNDNGQSVNVAVSTAFLKFKPRQDKGVFDIEAAVNELKDPKRYPELAGKPDLLKAAEAQIKDRFNLWQASAKQREAERKGKIWDTANKYENNYRGAIAAVQKLPEWKELDGTDQRTLLNQIETSLKPPAASGASKEEVRINQDANYQILTENLDQLVSMSDDEIRALTPQLGRVNVNKAISLKRKAGTDAATVKFDKDLLDSRAFKAGIAVYDADGKTDKGKKIKASMAQLNDRAEEVILAKQKNLGRPLRDDEKTQVIDTLLMVVPVRMQQKGGLFGDGAISYDDKRVFEVRDSRNVGRPGDREKVIKAYTDKGVQPTEEQILRGISALNKK